MPTDRWIGQTLGGRYQIVELLGQGGMSAVYKAKDPNLKRTVAIKLIHPHLSDNQEFVRRFESEATSIAQLRHPNIVQVFDFNHEEDLYYMVLEYVAGETLQSRIKRLNETGRHLPIKDILHYTIDICKAADYAHQRGMIHRDIKPANVMLDVNGNAILMDFGIARIVGGQQHTATGAVLGTALYMSPEQIQGLHPDARSDIYSLGVTLFEALGGRPPFEADSVMTLMMMHLNDPVPDLSQLNPGIPEPVKAIVNRSLEKDRSNRFQSCAEMADALQKAMDSISEVKPAATGVPIKEVKPAAPPPMETVIETAPKAEPLKTIIEPAVSAPPLKKPAETIAREKPAVEKPPIAERPPFEKPPEAQAVPKAPPSKKMMTWGIVAAAVVVLAVGGFFVFTRWNPSPTVPTPVQAAVVQPTSTLEVMVPTSIPATATAKPLPTDTQQPLPTETSVPPTATVEVVPTSTSVPMLAAVGGADKIAFMSGNNIYTANIDGSEIQQLTTDGTVKTYLRWLPDGKGLSYISGKCILTIDLQGTSTTVTCFNYSTYLDAFEVSHDGKRVALSLDRELYLLPFDLEKLSKANSHPDLVAMADCKELAPYQRNAAISARWSKDDKLLAIIILGVLGDGRRGDLAQVIAVDRCIANPAAQIQFPPPHFTTGEYNKKPSLPGFTWDGDALFAMNGFSRNDGFGDLYIFNWQTYIANTNANPIDGKCCYRDPQFSPDGQYLLFAFQDMSLGADSKTQLYYVPFGTLDTGAQYQPLAIPEYTNPKEDPQAILRPAAAP